MRAWSEAVHLEHWFGQISSHKGGQFTQDGAKTSFPVLRIARSTSMQQNLEGLIRTGVPMAQGGWWVRKVHGQIQDAMASCGSLKG